MLTTAPVSVTRQGARQAGALAFNRPTFQLPLRQANQFGQATGELVARPNQDLLLLPGQLHFGNQAAKVRTLLGSCVAITLWHPTRRLGGMCHFLLPSRKRVAGASLDGRFGDEAVERLVALLSSYGTRPQEYVAHLYGGADTMPEGSGVKLNIGERNIEQGWTLIDRYGFQLEGVDVGDQVPRTVTLAISSGEVWMSRSRSPR
jgi:chemotaxis protein CheD